MQVINFSKLGYTFKLANLCSCTKKSKIQKQFIIRVPGSHDKQFDFSDGATHLFTAVLAPPYSISP